MGPGRQALDLVPGLRVPGRCGGRLAPRLERPFRVADPFAGEGAARRFLRRCDGKHIHEGVHVPLDADAVGQAHGLRAVAATQKREGEADGGAQVGTVAQRLAVGRDRVVESAPAEREEHVAVEDVEHPAPGRVVHATEHASEDARGEREGAPAGCGLGRVPTVFRGVEGLRVEAESALDVVHGSLVLPEVREGECVDHVALGAIGQQVERGLRLGLRHLPLSLREGTVRVHDVVPESGEPGRANLVPEVVRARRGCHRREQARGERQKREGATHAPSLAARVQSRPGAKSLTVPGARHAARRRVCAHGRDGGRTARSDPRFCRSAKPRRSMSGRTEWCLSGRAVGWLLGRLRLASAGHAGGRRAPLWRALEARGADRELCRWARVFGADVARAWRLCPRGVWALEMAARAGVDHPLIALAVEACFEIAGEGPVVAGLRAEVRRTTDGWARGEVPTDVWRDVLEAGLAAAVDADTDVRQAADQVRYAHSWGNHPAFLQASNVYDAAYRAAHRKFADRVRGRISAHAVDVALYGLERHPYR